MNAGGMTSIARGDKGSVERDLSFLFSFFMELIKGIRRGCKELAGSIRVRTAVKARTHRNFADLIGIVKFSSFISRLLIIVDVN